MSPIILNTFGSYGDIHPYMAIAIELETRGYDVIIATSALYREKIESAGLKLFPIRPDLPPPELQEQALMDKIMEPRTGPKFLMDGIIFPAIRAGYEDLSTLLKTVGTIDLLVTHPAAPAGPLLARKAAGRQSDRGGSTFPALRAGVVLEIVCTTAT
jgi:rhamnosyltransferase subunit B